MLPEGTGVEIVPGSRLILQVHYNLDNVRPAPDRSTVELQLADSVAKRGSYVPLVDFRWLAFRQTFRIQAGRKRNVHTVTLDPRPFLPVVGARIDLSRGFTIHSVLHHMHLLGKRGDIALVRASGRRVPLLSIRDWHFHWQREYQLARPETFLPGDQLSLRCEHDNTAAHQPVVNGRRQRRARCTGARTRRTRCASRSCTSPSARALPARRRTQLRRRRSGTISASSRRRSPPRPVRT